MIKLNDFGRAVWKHKINKNLFACRSYDWVDRILTIDESIDRTVVSDDKFSTFDFTNWEPMTVAEHNLVKRRFKEIYE